MNQHRVNPPKNPATGDDKPTKTTMKSNHDTVIQPRNDMLKDAKTPKGCISIQRPKQQTEGKTACLGQTISLRAHQQPGGKPAARGHNSSPRAQQQPEGTPAARGHNSSPRAQQQPGGTPAARGHNSSPRAHQQPEGAQAFKPSKTAIW